MNDRRNVFRHVAEDYDRLRPKYSQHTIKYIINLATPKDVLEIAAGTGQATGLLLAQGIQLTAIDISPEMISILKRNYGTKNNLTTHVTSYEDFRSDKKFDLVICFQGIHWIEPKLRFKKSASLLKPGGYICWVNNIPSPDKSLSIWQNIDQIYQQYFPESQNGNENKLPPHPRKLIDDSSFKSPLYRKVKTKEFHMEESYSKDNYINLLKTMSNHIIHKEKLEPFYQALERRLEDYGQDLTVPYKTLIITRQIDE